MEFWQFKIKQAIILEQWMWKIVKEEDSLSENGTKWVEGNYSVLFPQSLAKVRSVIPILGKPTIKFHQMHATGGELKTRERPITKNSDV